MLRTKDTGVYSEYFISLSVKNIYTRKEFKHHASKYPAMKSNRVMF